MPLSLSASMPHSTMLKDSVRLSFSSWLDRRDIDVDMVVMAHLLNSMNFLDFVMTYAPGGELLKHLLKVGSFSIPCCRFYTGELLLGLSHLHKLRIVHRDLKPENILLDRLGHILITDFGSSKLLEENDAVAPGEFTSIFARKII